MDKNVISSFLRVFKKIPIEILESNGKMFVNVEYGLVYSRIQEEYKEDFDKAIKEVFVNKNKINDTFHKSFLTVVQKNQRHLWIEAAVHYFTTYGLESLGIDSDGFVYLPDEVCDVPELQKFLYIPSIENADVHKRISEILSSGVALSDQMINDIISIVNFCSEPKDWFSLLGISKNRDVATRIMYEINFIPDDVDEKMRLLNYAFTNKTSIIKNKKSNVLWQCTVNNKSERIIKNILEDEVALSSVFYRYKPLFLALRHNRTFGDDLKKKVNKIRRLAVKNHKPMKMKKYLTTEIKNGLFPDEQRLEKLSVFELATIYNKISYYLNSDEPVGAYVIRNGSVYVKKIEDILDDKTKETMSQWLEMIRLEIKDRYYDYEIEVKLPENFDIAFPISEKSFVGSVPLYSTITLKDEASVIGVQWENKKDGDWIERVDIDLSLITDGNRKFGWDGSYKSVDGNIIYSGDMTTGPAAESFYVGKDVNALVQLNLYNAKSAEYFLFFSNENERMWKYTKREFTTDPNKLMYSEKLTAETRNETIGVFSKEDGKTTFSFAKLSLGESNVSFGSSTTKMMISYLKDMSKHSLKISDIFDCVETFSNDYEDEDVNENIYEYDLTNLDKTTILGLVAEMKVEE